MNSLLFKWRPSLLFFGKCRHYSDKVSNSDLPLTAPSKKSLTPNNESKDKLEPVKYTKANKWHATYTFKAKSNDAPTYQGPVIVFSLTTLLLYFYFRKENSIDKILERQSVVVNSDGSITINLPD